MKSLLFTLCVAGTLVGCATPSTKSPDVSTAIRGSLDQAHLGDVSVSQDRDKGVVTLGGHVAAENEKAHAESIAQSFAAGEVVANQIAVLPPGGERDAKAVTSDLDKGIEQNLDAVLIQNALRDGVTFGVTTGVVTLSGEVDSQRKRMETEKVASSVPHVEQVVNELQVKNQKATSR